MMYTEYFYDEWNVVFTKAPSFVNTFTSSIDGDTLQGALKRNIYQTRCNKIGKA